MELSLNNNIQSLLSQNNLFLRTQKLNKNFIKVATGQRINSASDDAAAVSVSDGISKQIQGQKQVVQAMQDGINMLTVADGALSSISQSILRIRELTLQASNGTYTSQERRGIAEEVSRRLNEIDRLALSTKSGHVDLLNGTASQCRIQTGIDSSLADNTLRIGDVLLRATASAIGFISLGNITAAAGGVYGSGSNARSYLNTIDTALNNLNNRRAQVGSYKNRLDALVNNSYKAIETYTQAYSSILDANMAEITSDIAKQNILRDSAASILMQANSNPSVVLQLLAA